MGNSGKYDICRSTHLCFLITLRDGFLTFFTNGFDKVDAISEH